MIYVFTSVIGFFTLFFWYAERLNVELKQKTHGFSGKRSLLPAKYKKTHPGLYH